MYFSLTYITEMCDRVSKFSNSSHREKKIFLTTYTTATALTMPAATCNMLCDVISSRSPSRRTSVRLSVRVAVSERNRTERNVTSVCRKWCLPNPNTAENGRPSKSLFRAVFWRVRWSRGGWKEGRKEMF